MIQESRIETETATAGPSTRRMPGPASAVHETHLTAIQRLSWGALIVGAVVAMAIQALLAVLGVAIGLSLAPVTPAEGLAVGAGIWWLITGLTALFAGGYVAGRFCYIRYPFHSFMHGIMTWCLVTVFAMLLIGWMGGVVAAGPLGAIVDDLVHVQAHERTARVEVDVPERVAVGVERADPQRTPARHGESPLETEGDIGAMGAAWWTFFALLLGLAAAGFGGYLAAPSNLRETSGGFKGTARTANEAEREY